VLQLQHGLAVVLRQGQPGADGASVYDGEGDSTTSSNKVQGQDWDVKVVPKGNTQTSIKVWEFRVLDMFQ
jgi:hypothetical protein